MKPDPPGHETWTLGKHSKKGMTVFIASHSKKDIETLCDVVYIIQNGTIEKTQIADG